MVFQIKREACFIPGAKSQQCYMAGFLSSLAPGTPSGSAIVSENFPH